MQNHDADIIAGVILLPATAIQPSPLYLVEEACSIYIGLDKTLIQTVMIMAQNSELPYRAFPGVLRHSIESMGVWYLETSKQAAFTLNIEIPIRLS